MRREDFDRFLMPWLQLASASGVSNLRLAGLLTHFGSAAAVLAQPQLLLAELLGSAKRADAVLLPTPALFAYADKVFDWLTCRGEGGGLLRALLPLGHPAYPASLAEIDDPPLLLYVVGAERWLSGWAEALPPAEQCQGLQADAPATRPWWQQSQAMLAMVGSRRPTPQGCETAKRLASELREGGVTVVSGMALGIDGAAHEGALAAAAQAGVATVAVLGTGVDRVYPAAHKNLAHSIAAQGLLISEQALGMPPLPANFPRRNRIITGMCQATLVIEAAQKSGSLVSARLALEQGRDVMAVPGSILSAQSQGCHWLIKQGARLVDSASDVFEELNLPVQGAAPAGESPVAASPAGKNRNRAGDNNNKSMGLDRNHSAALPSDRISAFSAGPHRQQEPGSSAGGPASGRYGAVLEALGYGEETLESLLARTGLPTEQLQVLLLELELAGQVARMPGGVFQRIGRA